MIDWWAQLGLIFDCTCGWDIGTYPINAAFDVKEMPAYFICCVEIQNLILFPKASSDYQIVDTFFFFVNIKKIDDLSQCLLEFTVYFI